MATLGCGSHQAAVVDRAGAVVAHLDVLTDVVWARLLSEVSAAVVRVDPSPSCCGRLAEVRSWRHNLLIWRDGELVWSGPIVNPVRWDTDGALIGALDVLAWLDRRVPHADASFRGVDLMDVAEWLVADGFAPDDPGHTVQVIRPAGVLGDRDYTRDVGQTGDHLRDLADTGLDFTAVGSRIVLLPEGFCEIVGVLSDDDFPDGLEVVEDGAEVATRWVVWGEGDEPVKGTAGGIHPYYGLLERYVEQRSIPTVQAATATARARLRGSLPAPVLFDSQTATLSPDAGVDVTQLVPGWCVQVTSRATCRPINQAMKLTALRVEEDEDGETVAVTLAPAGQQEGADVG